MLTKKKFRKYRADKHGFAIGDKVSLKKIFSEDETRVFTIINRLSAIKGIGTDADAYSLVDQDGKVPRTPLKLQADGYEYYSYIHLKKIKN